MLENTTEKYALEIKSDGDNLLSTKGHHSQDFYPYIIDII